MTLTEDILLKYADGLLDAARAADVEAALVHDDVAAERVRLMRLSGTALKAEAARVDATDDKTALAQRFLAAPIVAPQPATFTNLTLGNPTLSSPRRSRVMQALAAGLMLAIGLGIGFASGLRHEASAHPVWVMRVVDYHTLYGRSTVAGSQMTPADVATLEQRFAAALGRPVKIPVYTPSAMEFRRGQILEFERAPIIQLAYLPPRDGTPMALCLKRTDGVDSEPAYERVHGIGMVRWHRAGLDYVLVGDQSEQALQSYAREAIAQIAAVGRT